MPRRRSKRTRPHKTEPTPADLNLPNTWLARFARRMLRSRNGKRAVRKIITNPDSPAFAQMWRELARRGYGDVPKDVNVSAKISLADLVAPPATPPQIGGKPALRLASGTQGEGA